MSNIIHVRICVDHAIWASRAIASATNITMMGSPSVLCIASCCAWD